MKEIIIRSQTSNSSKLIYENSIGINKSFINEEKFSQNISLFNINIKNKIYEKSITKLVYKINSLKNDEHLNILGNKFVKNNNKKCKIIFKNKQKSRLLSTMHINKLGAKLKLKLKLLDDFNNLDSMFLDCHSLVSISGISEWNTKKIKNMNSLFHVCHSLEYLPDISKWDTSNVKTMKSIFDQCISLKELPDISKWNINKVEDISCLFYDCRLLKYLPDISNWNTSNVKYMSIMFYNCSYLTNLPDISKWNTRNVKDMNNLFRRCSSLFLFT